MTTTPNPADALDCPRVLVYLPGYYAADAADAMDSRAVEITEALEDLLAAVRTNLAERFPDAVVTIDRGL